jgi:hypothetical protein
MKRIVIIVVLALIVAVVLISYRQTDTTLTKPVITSPNQPASIVPSPTPVSFDDDTDLIQEVRKLDPSPLDSDWKILEDSVKQL